MSSSGKGQSLVKSAADVQHAWDYAQHGGRAGAGRVIVEGFIRFDYEITLLTVRHAGGTSFCAPSGTCRWTVTTASPGSRSDERRGTGGIGADRARRDGFARRIRHFRRRAFRPGDEVWFSEVSPRPHDTGLVTLVSQD